MRRAKPFTFEIQKRQHAMVISVTYIRLGRACVMVQLYSVCNIQGAADGGVGGAETTPPEPEEERPEVCTFYKYIKFFLT